MKCFKKNFKKFDKFGKEPTLYYKGEEKKSTNFGIIISLLYIIIYITYFIYKLIRMFKKFELVFYDTLEYIEQPPIINLTVDNFYGGFALENPETYNPFIDETIYIPKAYFKLGKRFGDEWDWEIKEIKVERCKLEKFGKFFQNKFNNNSLNNLYCFEEMNEKFIGHFSYDFYSFFYIQLFPCINKTENNNHCKPKEIIDNYLKSTFVSMEFEDVELTPQNYSNPVMPINQNIYFKVGKKILKEIHIYYQIVNIETDLENLGIDEFHRSKNEQFLKYHSTNQMVNLIEDDIYENGESFCDITIKLYDQVRIQRRTYTNLFSVLEDVGGLMEIVKLFFIIVTSFFIGVLYKISIVNNLFYFNFKKEKFFNRIKVDGKIENLRYDNSKYENSIDKKKNLSKSYGEKISNGMNDNDYNNNINYRNNITSNNITAKTFNLFLKNSDNLSKDKNKENNNNNILNKEQIDSSRHYKNEIKNNEENKDKKKEKIKINKAFIYFCLCFVKKSKSKKISLLNKSMKLFTKKMDICTLFKNIYKNDEDLKNKDENFFLKDSD